MPARCAVVEAPSILGLFPSGVQHLAEVLIDAGLADRLAARRAGRIVPPQYDSARDPATGLLNPFGVRDYAVQVADVTGDALDHGEFPVVLGGDCSILLGPLLALRRRGRFGLLFLDGHADFYQPEAEPNGEIASMDLAIATGRGPRILADLEGRGPLLRDEDVFALGRRDAAEAEAAGSQRIEDTDIAVLDFQAVRRLGAQLAARSASQVLDAAALDGFWIHLDCDVLDDKVMPAVDYRLPGGLSWQELESLLQMAIASGRAVGLDVTIYNPTLDEDRSIARRLVECLVSALRERPVGGNMA